MAVLNKTQLQLIVEKSLRDNGFSGGDAENMWKTTVNGVEMPVNLQNLRDAISDAIITTMENSIATGSFSILNTQGVPVIATPPVTQLSNYRPSTVIDMNSDLLFLNVYISIIKALQSDLGVQSSVMAAYGVAPSALTPALVAIKGNIGTSIL